MEPMNPNGLYENRSTADAAARAWTLDGFKTRQPEQPERSVPVSA
jgi:hypothetical protein